MIQLIREFIIKEGALSRFELVFGPGGEWSKLFARSPGFRGTTMLRDTRNPQRYLSIDVWDTVAQREQALAECKAEYAILEDTFAGWAESIAEVGVFQVRAGATVRSRGKARAKPIRASRSG